MATSRIQTPVNLKERIAALQQRNVSSGQHQTTQAASRSIPAVTGTGALRDKIAKFEEKGGVPVPRGSFGMGAPQLAENAPAKKRGELYGNRIQGLGRPSGPPTSRSGSPSLSGSESPSPRKRCVSTGGVLSSSLSRPNFTTDEPVPALPNTPPFSTTPRRNSLTVNFGAGRRVVSTGDAEGRAAELVDSPSPPSPTSSPVPEEPSDTPPLQLPTTESSSSLPDDCHATAENDDVDAIPSQPELTSSEVTTDACVSQDLVSTPASQEEAPPTVVSGSNVDPLPVEDTAPSVDFSISVDDASPEMVAPAHELEEAVNEGASDSEFESAPQSAVSQTPPVVPDPTTHTLPSGPTDTLPIAIPPASPQPAEEEPAPSNATTPSLPEKMVIPVIVSPSEEASSTISITVPTPKALVPPSIPSPDLEAELHADGRQYFKAVVHRKVTEEPATIAPASTLVAPPTPQFTRVRRTTGVLTVEAPPSPGYGDLAVLLEEAALLEMKLTEGDGVVNPQTEALLPMTPTSATFIQDPRSASASTLTGHHVPMPSTDSGSLSGYSVSIPSIREPIGDGEIPEEYEADDGRSLASTTFSQRSPSHRKYLASIRRLTNRRSSNYMPGAYPRDSISVSSEDSSPVATPPDSGHGKSGGFGIAWPGSSPKKSGSSVGRSSSFADKLFNRSRTRSNVSTADTDRSSLYESSQRNLTLEYSSDVSPGKRKDGADLGAPRPTSWMSPRDSSSEFSPSASLFDKDIFDAFPSVPQSLPPGPSLLDAGNTGAVGRASTLPVKGRKHTNQRLSMM